MSKSYQRKIFLSISEHRYNNDTLSSFNIEGELGENSIPDKENAVKVDIGTTVTSIGDWAFSGCSELTSVMIPDRVTSIGGSAFNGCDELMSVSFSGKTKTQVQGMSNYSWKLNTGCTIHCTDGDIVL